MNKIILFAIIVFSMNCSGQKNTAKTNPLVKELFQLNSNANMNEVKGLLKRINETEFVNKIDVFKEYILLNKPHHDYAIRFLPIGDNSEIGGWLEQNYNNIKDDYTWIEISKSITHFRRNDANTKIFELLLKKLNTTTNIDTRHEILFTFRYNSIYKESQYFNKLLDVEIDNPCRIDLYVILSRFKDVTIDSVLKSRILQWDEPSVLDGLLDDGIKRNDRYDFLPVLVDLKNKLLSIKNPAKLTAANETLELLSTVFPYLEQKKLEKAPIGLPLDWPQNM